jgi:hypothetical protein
MRIRAAIRTSVAALWVRGIVSPRRVTESPQRDRLEAMDYMRRVPEQTEFLA